MMRVGKTLMWLAVSGLVLASATTAFAAHNPGHAAAGDRGGSAAAEGANKSEARAQLVAAKRAAIESFQENRTRVLNEYRAALEAIRTSYLENKTRVIDECRPTGNGYTGLDKDTANMTAEEKEAYAHCVRDSLKPLKEEARAAMQEARDNAHEALKQYRGNAIGQFMKEQARIRAAAAASNRN